MEMVKKFELCPRRAQYHSILKPTKLLDEKTLKCLEILDLCYRTLCGVLYNFAPASGHPGGSISSGRFVFSLAFFGLDYDIGDPDRNDQDLIVYAAGHKALGLYSMWALRNEIVRIGKPELLPKVDKQFRFEDLLGFRRNPIQRTPLISKFNSKALDGHPTPATPFVKIATGASGVGDPAAIGLALGLMDLYGPNAAPKVHIIEGEGGMTPGRVAEGLAAASSSNLCNVVMHVDWNQASIDSECVCREGDKCGDYVQWTPAELLYLNDWNVIEVADGKNFEQILEAISLANHHTNDQPTAIVYRTIKGWQYGIEGRKSHGAGHACCSDEYYTFVSEPFQKHFEFELPQYAGQKTVEEMEALYWDTLLCVRKALEKNKEAVFFAAQKIQEAKRRLADRNRKIRSDAPELSRIYVKPQKPDPAKPPKTLVFEANRTTTLRNALGETLRELNRITNGAVIGCAADLLDSTSISKLNQDFPSGYFNVVRNPKSRLVAVGGICEDGMGAMMAGLSALGYHIGVTSSYGAFIAALEHIASRLHGIGQQARASVDGKPYRTFIMVNGHAGIKTGEDGPTHADPQALQLLQENFPSKVMITLTPWDPQELWPLMVTGLQSRPAVLAPFVTRPNEVVFDREALGIPPAHAAVKGIYPLLAANPRKKPYHGTIVLQGSEVGNEFVHVALPGIREKKLNLNVFYISSAELFDLLPEEEKQKIFPSKLASEAMGITGFTKATMYRWVTSEEGRKRILHPFRNGHYLGSGRAEMVLKEGGLSGEAILESILKYVNAMERFFNPPNPIVPVRPAKEVKIMPTAKKPVKKAPAKKAPAKKAKKAPKKAAKKAIPAVKKMTCKK